MNNNDIHNPLRNVSNRNKKVSYPAAAPHDGVEQTTEADAPLSEDTRPDEESADETPQSEPTPEQVAESRRLDPIATYIFGLPQLQRTRACYFLWGVVAFLGGAFGCTAIMMVLLAAGGAAIARGKLAFLLGLIYLYGIYRASKWLYLLMRRSAFRRLVRRCRGHFPDEDIDLFLQREDIYIDQIL